MQTIPFNELRSQLARTLREIEANQESVVISRRGKAAAVLMSYAQYEQLGKPPFDLAAAIDDWRARHGPAPSDPDDDPWADVRGREAQGGRKPVDFDVE